ncbi:MAG: mandelate racemase/muconate lactonizing enzyme family protein [Alphaproteobacteria bacterium]
MKITEIRVRTVEVPDEDVYAGPVERLPKIWPVVTLRIRTDQGVEGIGFAFSQGGLTRALHAATEELAALLVGDDPQRIEAAIAKLNRAASSLGGSGLFLFALAAIDTALWDIKGKVAGQPLWKLLGGTRNRIPCYASGPLHRGLSDDQIAGAAERIVAKGFRIVKMHLALDGDPTTAREVNRARLVREAVGPDIRLTCDINERWRTAQAIDIGRRLAELDFFWIEDPTRHDDYAGLAEIAAALDTPVMAGERNLGVTPYRLMLEARSVDIAMIDWMCVGGITPWLKIAAMAEAFNTPVISHLAPEIQAQLVAAVPNGLVAEFKSWLWRLFEQPPVFEDGAFVLSDRPGLGLSFSREFADRT